MIDVDAGVFWAEIIGVGTAAGCDQHVGTVDFGSPLGALDDGSDCARPDSLCQADALGGEAHIDAFVLQDCKDSGGDVFVFAADQAEPISRMAT
jgi:hypothetical protein